MKKWNISALAITGALVAFPLSSQAQFGGTFLDRTQAYAGAGLGYYAIDETFDQGDNFDDNNWAGKIFVGGKFNPYFGLEAGYVNFGEIEGEVRDAVDADPGGAPTFQADGWEVSAVGYLPLNMMVTPYAKVGQLFYDTQVEGGLADDVSANDTFFGVGAQFDINETWGARVEYDRYNIGGADANTFWGMATIKF